MDNRTREQLWRDHLARFRESGLTQRAYCEQHALAIATFQYWKRRLAATGTALVRSTPEVEWVAVDVPPPAAAQSMRVVARDGTSVELGIGFSRDALREVMGALADVHHRR